MNITQGTSKTQGCQNTPKKPLLPCCWNTYPPSYLSLELRSDTTNHQIKPNRPLNNMMDVTFVLEESGVTATVEVPCEADVAAAKEVACTALAVSPASVEMRIGTQVLEGTCRLQDTAFGAGVQVVLARCFADIKCPAECSVEKHATSLEAPTGRGHLDFIRLSLSPCGALCLFTQKGCYVTGLDTDTFETAFKFEVNFLSLGAPAISQCKTRCYMASREGLHEVALPGGEVVRKVDGIAKSVFACGSVVVSQGRNGVSVYDEDLTLLRTLSSDEVCGDVAVSDCGGWVITSSNTERNVRLWDVNTGEAVACVPAGRFCAVALSRSASVFAVANVRSVRLYDWSGAALGSFGKQGAVRWMLFTPCGKYLLLVLRNIDSGENSLHQYDVATTSCVRAFSEGTPSTFLISPCSRVVLVLFSHAGRDTIETRHLYPY